MTTVPEASRRNARRLLGDNPALVLSFVFVAIFVATDIVNRIQAGQAFQRGEPDTARALSNRGVGEMEAAVAMAPADPGVLVPRGAVLSGAARAVGDPARAAAFLRTAVGDYEKAVAVQTPAFPQMSEHARGELLGGLADGWQRLGDEDRARGYLTRMVAELPGSPYADAATKWLELKPMLGGPALTCVGCHE